MKKDNGKKPMSTVSLKTQETLNKLKKNLISMKNLQLELDAGNIDYLDVLPLISGGVQINDKYVKLIIEDYEKRLNPGKTISSGSKFKPPSIKQDKGKNPMSTSSLDGKSAEDLQKEINEYIKLMDTKKKSSKPKPSSSKNEPMISKFKKLSVSNKPSKKPKIAPELSSLLASVTISKREQNMLDKIRKLTEKAKSILDLDYTPEQKYKFRPQWMIEQKNKRPYIRPTILRRSSIVDTIQDEMIKRGLKRGTKIIYLEEPPVIKKPVKRKRSSTSSSGSASSMSSIFSKSSKGSVKSSKSFDYEPQED